MGIGHDTRNAEWGGGWDGFCLDAKLEFDRLKFFVPSGTKNCANARATQMVLLEA
jgi:hypothetical protein